MTEGDAVVWKSCRTRSRTYNTFKRSTRRTADQARRSHGLSRARRHWRNSTQSGCSWTNDSTPWRQFAPESSDCTWWVCLPTDQCQLLSRALCCAQTQHKLFRVFFMFLVFGVMVMSSLAGFAPSATSSPSTTSCRTSYDIG